MKKSRKQFTSQFKAKVVLEVLSQTSSINEISSRYWVHITQIWRWRKEFMQNASSIFSNQHEKEKEEKDKKIEELYKKIWQYDVEIDWLKKKVGIES